MITVDALDRMAASHGQARQPDTSLAVLAEILAAQPGYRLFTVLLHDPARNEIRRAFSSRPAEYPVGGAKPITESSWDAAGATARRALCRPQPPRHPHRVLRLRTDLVGRLRKRAEPAGPVERPCRRHTQLAARAHWYDDTVPERLVTLAKLATPALLSLQGK